MTVTGFIMAIILAVIGVIAAASVYGGRKRV